MWGAGKHATMPRCMRLLLLVVAAAALLLLVTPTSATADAATAGRLRRGQRATTAMATDSTMHDDAADGVVPHAAARRRAMARVGALRLRAHAAAAAESQADAQSVLSAGAAATLKAVSQMPFRVSGRGAGGRAGRAGGKAGATAGNAGQSGRKAGDAAGNGGQSGRKAGDAAGNGGQSGRKAGDASGNGGQSGRKAGNLPVSPVLTTSPPSASNIVTLAGIERPWPVKVYLRNQGDAATCWAHSAVTLLELRQQMGLDRNRLHQWISVDQVLKCVKHDGMGGGNPLDAISFLIAFQRQSDTAVRGGEAIKCDQYDHTASLNPLMSQTSGRTPVLAIRPCTKPGENCARMRDYEYEMERQFADTPMLVYVDASQWHTYAPRFARAIRDTYALGTAADYSAVAFPTSKCSMDPAKGDHVAILLGTVTCPKTKKKFWRVFNSWGREWGLNGYIYLPFEQNACGLANYPVGLTELGLAPRKVGNMLGGALLMLPKTMSRTAALVSPEYKFSGAAVAGGKEVWDKMQQEAKKKK